MDDFLRQLLLDLPNFAAFLIALWYLSRKFDRVLNILITLLLSLLEVSEDEPSNETADAPRAEL